MTSRMRGSPPHAPDKSDRTPADSGAGTARAARRPRTRAEPGGDDLARRRVRSPGIQLDCGAGRGVRHVGMVFVHGIGSQQPAETLLDWGGAIIRLLLDVRVGQHAAGDPVIASQLDPPDGQSRYIELQLPATTTPDGTTIPEQHWVMTEAWWAQRIRPPSFGQMAEWLGPRGAIRRILLAILPRNRGGLDPRLRAYAQVHPMRRGPDGVEEAVEPEAGAAADVRAGADGDEPSAGPEGGAPSADAGGMAQTGRMLRARAGGGLLSASKIGAALYLQAFSALLLVVYGALRSIEKLIPIGPLRDGALTRPLDTFVLDWFGDVYVLLGDPAQAASVRGRLVDTVSDLNALECDTVVVVAHSGGAIVSYMTLADPANQDLRVDRLITLGEGLNLAWLLTGGEDDSATEEARERYVRLYADAFVGRDDLAWDDFWASQDPAPVGLLHMPLIAGDEGDDDAKRLARIDSHAIWNQLSFQGDHGAYWDNDEEFLLPMLRLVDGQPGRESRFGDEELDRQRSNRRRRRLSVLSLWRQLCLTAPMAAIVGSYALGFDAVPRAADAVAGAWAVVPGSNAVSGPLDTLRAAGLADQPLGRYLAESGVWVVAAVIALVTLYALIAPPERSVPWLGSREAWFGHLLRLAPSIVAAPIFVLVLYGALRFVGGSTSQSIEAGWLAVAVITAVLVVAFVVPTVAGSAIEDMPALLDRVPTGVRDGLELVQTVIVLLLAIVLIAAPIVSIIAFVDVGRTVLGSVAVVVGFQILGQIGAWRWSVWDARERTAARSAAGVYLGVRRVIAQAALLVAVLAAALLGVLLDAPVLVLAAVAGAGLVVLLGVAVDVLDASRRDRTGPGESLLRFTRGMRRS